METVETEETEGTEETEETEENVETEETEKTEETLETAEAVLLRIWKSMTHSLTYLLSDNLKARDASASKNRNYHLYKKISFEYLNSKNIHGVTQETITRLKEKKDKAFRKSKYSAIESKKANLHCKFHIAKP